MGAYDGAEICELVGYSLLYELSKLYEKKDIGLYRDDAVAVFNPFKCQSHKIVKHTQTIRRQIVLGVFDHFVKLALKGLRIKVDQNQKKLGSQFKLYSGRTS